MKISTVKSACLLLVAAVALTVPASAQGVGPDVIVGGLPDISNYSHSGGVDAFSVGTTSCNIGTANLLWISGNNQHPVIGQHAFRLHDNRFEQVGQSWLKHGFFALSQTLCGSCPNPTNGTSLGVLCSDPYGSGLNGQQNGLGPKFEVDAFTGGYPYPATNLNNTGNSIYKRLQIALTDLDPSTYPGALYFVEGHYVTADDAAAGNHYNNASHRQVQFAPNGGGYNMSFAPGSNTVQQQPAIFAWKNIDPSVDLQAIDIPGEGRFWVGFKIIDNGNGTYDWEFAVHNLNSHLSGRLFSVTAPAGANITNVGFHDVAYHSGEPFDGTDWASSINGSTVSWQTGTFAQNQNANALRWGTTYNFRFRTDVAPTGVVNGSIGLYRPTTNPTVNFSFAPAANLVQLAGDDQGVNLSEPFAPCVVRVQTIGGQAIPGVAVTFSKTGTSASFTSPTSVMTDANGDAQVSLVASNTLGGATTVTATIGTGQVQFNLYVRRFDLNWLSGPGVLVFSAQTDLPSMPMTLTIDDSNVPVLPTIFGPIYSSILNPGPNFIALSAFPGVGFQDPTVMTSVNGTWTRVFTGMGALNGSGLDVVAQVLGYHFVPGGGQFWFSNPDYQIF